MRADNEGGGGGRRGATGGAGARGRDVGRRGEEAAAAHLESLGWTILERNWRSSFGEIDLVALDGETLVFVEVKARSGAAFGTGLEAVGRAKRERLARSAMAFMGRKRMEGSRARFDVVSLEAARGGGWRIDHVRNAFDLPFEG